EELVAAWGGELSQLALTTAIVDPETTELGPVAARALADGKLMPGVWADDAEELVRLADAVQEAVLTVGRGAEQQTAEGPGAETVTQVVAALPRAAMGRLCAMEMGRFKDALRSARRIADSVIAAVDAGLRPPSDADKQLAIARLEASEAAERL